MKLDIIVDLQYGDTGKGREVYNQLKNNSYDYVIRYAGSNNCGHSFIHNGQRLATHSIPAGIFFDIPSIIGPGCLLNVKHFFKELAELEEKTGKNISKLVKVAKNVHIITEAHLEEEKNESRIGTTRTGVGPAVRDKYARVGITAETIPELQPYLIDFVEEMHSHPDAKILAEGSQGFYLDIHFTPEYPYCTSTHTTTAAVLLNGLSWKDINKVVGVIKPYQTYVGKRNVQKSDPIFEKIQVVGNEIGVTTGRKRQVFLLNPKELVKAAKVNGITELVVNKMDILKEVNYYWVGDGVSKVNLKTEENFKSYIEGLVKVPVSYNYSPEVS